MCAMKYYKPENQKQYEDLKKNWNSEMKRKEAKNQNKKNTSTYNNVLVYILIVLILLIIIGFFEVKPMVQELLSN